MISDIYFKQLKGPFSANQTLISSTDYAFKIAISSEVGHKVKINNVEMELGKTGMLEIRDTKITSLLFMQNESADTFVEICGENK